MWLPLGFLRLHAIARTFSRFGSQVGYIPPNPDAVELRSSYFTFLCLPVLNLPNLVFLDSAYSLRAANTRRNCPGLCVAQG